MMGGPLQPCVLLLTLLGLCFAVTPLMEDQQQVPEIPLNLRPIIGILSQEPSRSMNRVLSHKNYTSYIAASYVKYYESAGARVVPILINQNETYYREIMESINGLVFPGGAVPITQESGYGRAGRMLYDILLEAAHLGKPTVPLFATCLGFEMLMYLSDNNTNPLTSCRAKNRADPLYLQEGWNSSQLLGEAPEDVLDTLANTNATSNFHKWCVTPETFQNSSLEKNFLLLSTSEDDDGLEYVSTVEHRHLPIYGFQWHPEKNIFEWGFDSIPHTLDAIRSSQYIANFFVEKARLNNQTFPTEEEEIAALIYNHSPIYTATLYPSSFQQCYFFK
ncbi:gamma-glutamyl hydrolase-like [Homarus americanus]|uniref:gamma-glutamyl hydrolase-like n=1 Tax=Homarus americanus TaxID=6706 RepID=UPI001C48143F|nr:gamma-glutamyl hydrolase-like [Homarus americanus]XP_042205920.1 gamma-glutamyl hydrolase-like [Homarus americanus]